MAEDVRQHAVRSAGQLQDEATARLQDARGKAGDLVEMARTYATDHPLATFGFGILFGLFLARRHR